LGLFVPGKLLCNRPARSLAYFTSSALGTSKIELSSGPRAPPQKRSTRPVLVGCGGGGLTPLAGPPSVRQHINSSQLSLHWRRQLPP